MSSQRPSQSNATVIAAYERSHDWRCQVCSDIWLIITNLFETVNSEDELCWWYDKSDVSNMVVQAPRR